MHENLVVPVMESKQQQYSVLLKKIREIVYNEDNLTVSLTSVAAILHHGMGFSWTAFYFVKGEEMVLGPFEGVAARMQVPKREGILGAVYAKESIMVVNGIEQFSAAISDGLYDQSGMPEIAVPAFNKGDITLMLNINSNKNFTEVDQKYLQQVIHLIEEVL